MTFGEVDDGVELIASVAEVLRRECGVEVVRAAAADPSRGHGLWTTATKLGWPALGVPARYGGLGANVSLTTRVLECAGAAVFPAPLLSTALATALLGGFRDTTTDSAAGDALSRIADGTAATVAVAGAVHWDGRTLHGTKREVTDLPGAEILVVTADRADGPPVVVLADPADTEIRVRPNVDATRPLAEVELRGTAGTLLDSDAEVGCSIATVLVAADLLGVASRALDIAVEYAGTRIQFGRPIGAFGAIKHRLADTYVAVERARSLVYEAAAVLDGVGTDSVASVDISVAMAKAAATEAASFAVRGAVQVSGAVGITAERGLVLLLRRAHQGAHLFGDAAQHYRTVAAALAGEASLPVVGEKEIA